MVRKRRNCGVFSACTCLIPCILFPMRLLVVRKWRLVVWLRLKFIVLRRLRCSFRAFSIHDFTNFTKHSTVLTSILQQINTLYQHFSSVKTAIPALEQAKTMLKIALPTFKNDENHTQNSKIHIQNSGFEVRCGENSVLWRRFHD